MKRYVGGLVALAIVTVACGTDGPTPTPTQGENPSVSVSPSPSPVEPVEPLVGTWQRVTTCEEFVKAQKEAGFEEVVLDGVVGNGFIPGVTNADQLADPSRPCEGSVPREHSHFFTEFGTFGSLDWRGEQVDDGTYEIINDRTFVIGDFTFHYRIIGGDKIMFDPVIPNDCSTNDCRGSASWGVAVAYPGETWERVS